MTEYGFPIVHSIIAILSKVRHNRIIYAHLAVNLGQYK